MRPTVLMAPDPIRFGLGHTARCIALAQALEQQGHRVEFLATDAMTTSLILAAGFRCREDLEGSWTIAAIDSYTRPLQLLRRLRPRATAIVAFDDLHRLTRGVAELLIRPSLGERTSPHVLGGSRYVLLRREYWRTQKRVVRSAVSHVLLALGAFPRRSTLVQALTVIRNALPEVQVDIAVGQGADPGVSDRRLVHVWEGMPTLLPLLERADIVVTAGGQTMCEALATGAPALILGTAVNQAQNVRGAASASAGLSVGWHDDGRWSSVLEARLRLLSSDRPFRRNLSQAARELIDGRGAMRAAAEVRKLI